MASNCLVSPPCRNCRTILAQRFQVYVEGRLKTRKWQDNNGQDRYTTEIQGDNLQMLGSSQGAQAPSAAAQKPTPAQPSQPVEFDDNIPF